ncbi:transposase (fragment) [Mesorhizobium sp. STM 4661]
MARLLGVSKGGDRWRTLMMHGDRAALDRRRQTGSAKLWLDKLRQGGMPMARWSRSPTGIVWSMLSSVASQPDCR